MTRVELLLSLSIVTLLGAGCAADGASNQPPILEIDVSELAYTVGDGLLRITLTAEDPEGGTVSFEAVNKPNRADLQSADNWAIFTWDPLAPDVTPIGEPLALVFAATDRQGARTEKVVSITIQAGNGIPRFLNSNSVLHTIGSNKPISFDVVVRDDDSDMVNLRMPPGFAPEGAEMTSTGPLTARFGWLPQPDQLEQRVHTVKFIADDGQNAPVEQNVTIILKKETSKTNDVQNLEPTDCGFEDRVSYQPLLAQRGPKDFLIEASFTSLNDGYDKIILNYSDQDVFNELEPMWTSVEMTEDAGVFSALIANPLLESGSQEIYYELCAVDDAAGTEDARAIWCGPTSLYDSFIVYPPTSEACEDDSNFDDTFEDANALTENEFAYLRLCEGDEDFFEVPMGGNQEGFVYIVYPRGAQPTIETFDQDQAPDIEPMPSSCSGFTIVRFENTAGPTKKYIKISANDDAVDIAYQVLIDVRDLDAGANCADAQYEPNEDPDQATAITTESAQFNGMEICRADDVDVFAISAAQGQEITIDAVFAHSIGDLDIGLFAPSERADVSTDGIGSDYGLSVSDNESITHIAAESGLYHLIVYTEDNPNTYNLTVAVAEAADACVDPGGNRTQNNSTLILPGTTPNLAICGGTEDWYQFLVLDSTVDHVVELSPKVPADLSGYMLEIWDLFGPVDTGVAQATKLHASFAPFTEGDHWVRVLSTADSEYDLTLTVQF